MGGGPPSSGGGSFVEPTNVVLTARLGVDLDSPADDVKDINLTFTLGHPVNISLPGDLTFGVGAAQNLSLGNILYCGSESGCASGAVYSPAWFEGFSCQGDATLNPNNASLRNHSINFTGPTIACLRTSKNVTYKIGANVVNAPTNMTLQFIQDTGGVGGSTALNVSSSSGISYFNASLKSIRLSRFDFATGETLLTHGVNYNVTSSNGVLVGTNVTILGSGGIKIKPIGSLSSGFYRVVAEFNTSDGSEKAETGFQVDTFSASCGSFSFSIQSGDVLQTTCTVSNPSGGNYQSGVDLRVEDIKNSFSRSSMSSSVWASAGNFTNSTRPSVIVTINQSLPTGFYEAIIKFNQSGDIKRQSIWFDVRDFDAQFYSTKWSYSALDNISFVARGTLGSTQFRINISGSPTVFRYDKATWSKSTVSDVTVKTQLVNVSEVNNATNINLSKSGGWDEGQYFVVLNLTRINGTNVATGSTSEVGTWFEVKLFDVYAYTSQWSYHPKSNVTITAFIGSPGGFNQKYGSSVNVNVTEVKNTVTGATLTKGTDYNVVDNTSVPSTTGDPIVKIIPVTALPTGNYKATINVRDSVSGRTIKAEAYFVVVAFYLTAWAAPYEVGAGENVSLILYASFQSSGGGNISNATITNLAFCNINYTCTNKAASAYNYSFRQAESRILIDPAGLGQGWYTATVVANDTQNANATAYTYFRIKSFGVSGFIPNPPSGRSGWGYQINESIPLNVTATPGVNITNATFSYYDCTSAGCTFRLFVVQIGYNMTVSNVILNMTPANITNGTSSIILNSTWPVNEFAYYNILVKGVKDGTEASYYTYANVYFPRASVSGPASVNSDGSIGANITVYVEPLTSQNLSGANITVTDVLQDTGYSLTSLSGWNVSSKIANSSGIAEINVTRTSTWPSGNLRVRYNIVYGNATTKAEFTTKTSARSLGFSKKLTNVTHTNATNNATVGVPFNVSITLNNPSTVDSNGTYLIVYGPVHSTNTSAVITLLNNSGGNVTSEMRVNVTAGSSATVSWMYNVSAGAGNYTQQILLQANSTFNTLGWVTYSNTIAVGSG